MPEELSRVYFYDDIDGDRLYDAESMTAWLKKFFVTGVFNGGLQVTANGNMTVTVQPGDVNIFGKATDKYATTAHVLDLEVASGTLNRIDNIVMRRDDVKRDIYLTVQTGGLAAKPVAPDIVRDNGIYDLKLAEVYIAAGTISITQSAITDTRMVKEVCGWVTAAVTEIDYTQILAQFNAFLAEYKPKIQDDYTAFIDFVTGKKNDTIAGYTAFMDFLTGKENDGTAAYNTLLTFFDNLRTASNAEHSDYLLELDNIKAQLEQEAAATYEDYAVFINLYKQYVAAQYVSFAEYLTGKKNDSSAAYTALLAWFDSFKVRSGDSFQSWFDSIKGILGEDEAGILLNLIQQLQARQPATPLGFDNVYGGSGYGQQTYGGGNKISVPHTLGRYPQFTLYRTSGAFGVGGFGSDTFGGCELVTMPAEFALDGRNRVTVKTLPEFAGFNIIRRTGENEYSIHSPDPAVTESLLLILY